MEDGMTVNSFSYFFKLPNKLNWSFIKDNPSDEWAIHINSWFQLYQEKKSVLAIPYLINDREAVWFVGSNSQIDARELKSELIAFFGSIVSEYDKNLLTMLPSDNKQIIEDNFKNKIFIVRTSDNQNVLELREKFSIYCDVLSRKSKSINRVRLPFSQIRREFDLALLAGEASIARQLLDQLKNTGRLTSKNHCYLEIRYAVGLRQWDYFNINFLKDVKNFYAPLAVVNDAAEYFFEIGIKKYLDTEDLQGCRTTLNKIGFFEFQNFFKRRNFDLSKETAYVCLLSSIYQENPNRERQHELLKLLIDKYPSKILEVIELEIDDTSDINVDIEDSISDKINSYFDNFDFDQVIELCLMTTPSAYTCTKLVHCLDRELPDEIRRRETEFFVRVRDYFNKLSIDEKRKLNPKVTQFFTDFNNIFLDQENENKLSKPESWGDWINCVEKGIKPSTSISFLESLSNSWEISRLTDDEEKLADFIEKLFVGNENAKLCFDQAWPHIYKNFIDIEGFSEKLVDLALKLMLELGIREKPPTELERYFLSDIQHRLLKTSLKTKQYEDLIDNCEIYIDRLKSYAHLDWMLDVTEIFSTNPKPSENAFNEFFSKVYQEVLKFKNRLSQHQIEIFNFLCIENNFDPIKYDETIKTNESSQEHQLINLFKNKKIGIYTLEENAGNRAKQIIQKQVPSCDVTVNSDKSGTRRLEDLAKNSDFFICAWKASKHAATIFIEKFRKSEDIIKPLGKGSSSIINALLEQAA